MEAVLSDLLQHWFRQRFGTPTPIQRSAWPAIAEGKNVLLSAPTGAGKTLAAFLPLLDHLLHSGPSAGIRVLYVSPLKALAADVLRNLRSALSGMAGSLSTTRLPRIALRTGDSSPRDRRRLWLDPPEILLTTPESLAVLLTHEAASDLFGGLRAVVVDEVHALATGKRGADLSLSLERLQYVTGELQRIGLSATATPLEESARFLAGEGRPCLIAHTADASPLELSLRPLPPGVTFLARLLDVLGQELPTIRSCIVFTNTRALAERVAWGLRRRYPQWDDQIAVHHSSLAPDRRRRVERRLKRGKLRAVVSSTSLELGIDVGSVDLVVLVHPPGDVVRLLQRVGRAGHAPGQPRRGLVLTSGSGELLEATVTAASGLVAQCEPLRLSYQPLDVLCQQLLGLSATRAWEPAAAFALIRRSSPYRDLSRADFDACLDYLLGCGDWLPARLRIVDGAFTIRDERTLRILQRNLGVILADDPCEVVLEQPEGIRLIGNVDVVFAERLQPGDRFILDGLCLEFRRLEIAGGKGGAPRLIAQELTGRPRVPRWQGEGLPMSLQMAQRLVLFRARAAEALREGPDVLSALLRDEYGLEADAVAELVSLFVRQETVSEVPDSQTLLIEAVPGQSLTTYYLHTPLNRKGNDALARVLGARFARANPGQPALVSLVANLGLALYVRGVELKPSDFRRLLSAERFEEDLQAAILESLVLRERFQRVAQVGLMLLRNPLGRKRRVGGRDWGERRLFEQVRAKRPDFVLLRQAHADVLEDHCDSHSACCFVRALPHLAVRSRRLSSLSPFAETWTHAEAVSEPLPTQKDILRQLHTALTTPEVS